MLEAFDFESVDQVSLFLGAITDRMLGDDREPELTELSYTHAESLKIFRSGNLSSFRTEPSLAYL